MTHLNERIIKNKLGLLRLAEELGNVSKACSVMGYSRDTFYRYKAAVEEGGVDALLDKTRRKPNIRNRTDEATEGAVVAFATDYPAYGQVRVSNELRKQAIFVSASGVHSIWLRNKLQSRKLRLKAQEAKASTKGLILTEAQVAALERHTPEIALLDIMMPDITGLDVAAIISDLEPSPTVILMTGFDDAVHAARKSHLEVFAVIEKPMPLRDVARHLELAFEERAA